MKPAIGIARGGVTRNLGLDRQAHRVDILGGCAHCRPTRHSYFHELTHFEKLSDRSLRREAGQISAWKQ